MISSSAHSNYSQQSPRITDSERKHTKVEAIRIARPATAAHLLLPCGWTPLAAAIFLGEVAHVVSGAARDALNLVAAVQKDVCGGGKGGSDVETWEEAGAGDETGGVMIMLGGEGGEVERFLYPSWG
jgi:hypothetical protein